MADPIETFIDVAGEPTDAAVGALQRLLASIDARLTDDRGLIVTLPRYGVDHEVIYVIAADGTIHQELHDEDIEHALLHPIDPDEVERILEERGPAGVA